MIKCGKKVKKIIMAFLVLLITSTVGVMYGDAMAVDKLTIKIGYFGWPASDYVEKSVFSASELYGMGTIREDYSYWDGSKRVAIDSSLGVPLTAIIDAAGIDQGSIAQMDFWTADSGNGAFTSFTWQQLIGTKRYYFKNLAACFEYENENMSEERKVIINTQKAWKNAKKVSAMMALEENWTWYEIGTSNATGTDNLGTANRFRLNFGQASPDEKRTFNSAKMVHTIYVMFSGTPQLSSEESNIRGKVGSSHKLKVSAAAVDEALESKIQEDVKWSSSDSSVVSVDENGNLTYKKAGTAIIYAKSRGAVKKFTVTVGSTDQNGQGDNKGAGEDKGNGSGKGTGSSKSAGTGDANKKEGENNKKKDVEKVKVKDVSNSFVLSDDASARLRSAFAKQARADEASMNTHQEEMAEDVKQLKIQKKVDYTAGLLIAMNGLFGVSGALFGVYRYRKQRWG